MDTNDTASFDDETFINPELQTHPDEASVFLEAAEIEDAVERLSFLDKACNRDVHLRIRVDALLAADMRDSTLEPVANTEFRQECEKSSKAPEGPEAGSSIQYFGDYVLISKVAAGAMGVVWRAQQVSLKREVALKMIKGVLLASDLDVQRFRIEAESAARLNHPNIVPIYEIGEQDEQHFFSMKLIEGGTLANHHERLRKDRRAAVTTMITIAGAMDAAHRAGVLHRDLKPGNILIDEDGEPHITDFGLAKNVGEDEHGLTMTGQIMGTPHYMAPEQARGESRTVSTAADVYGLGAILFELLSGDKPFSGESLMGVLEKVSSEPAPALRTLDLTIDRDLETITAKCLEKDPLARYATCADFAGDLQHWLDGEPISARPIGRGERLVKWMKRKPLLAAFAGLGAAFVLTLGIGGPIVAVKQADLRRQADESASIAIKRESETSKALARSATSLAEAALREGNGPAMQAALNGVPEDRRDSTWYYLHDQSDSSIARIETGMQITGVVAHPNQPSVFAVISPNSEVSLLNIRTGERLLHFTSDLPRAHFIAISPDGGRIAVSSPGGIAIYDSHDGGLINQWGSDNSGRIRFSPDGKLILSLRGRFVRLWDVITGDLRWSHESKNLKTIADFSADGQQVIIQIAYSHPLTVLNVLDGKEQRQLPSIVRPNTATMSPDGKLYVVGSLYGDLYCGDFSKSGPKFRARADSLPIKRIAFSATGARFVSIASSSDGRLLIRVWDTDTGAEVYPLLGGLGKVSDVAVHPLSGELIICGSETRVWDLGKPRWTFRRHSVSCIAFWGTDDVVFAPAENGYAELLHLQDPVPRSLWAPENAYHSTASVGARGGLAAIAQLRSAEPIILAKRTKTGAERLRSIKAPGYMKLIRLSPEGKLLAIVGRDNTPVQLIGTASGEPSVQLNTGNLKSFSDLAWISDQELMGVGTTAVDRSIPGAENHIVVWDVSNGKILRHTTHDSGMDVLAVEPGGRRFAEAGTDKHVRIRNSETLAVIKEFRVHDGAVTALAWHPEKDILATGSSDLTIRLWDVVTGERFDELRGPLRAPHQLAFAPGGRRLGCASLDGTTRIWDPVSLQNDTVAPPFAGDEAIDEREWFGVVFPSIPKAPVKLVFDADGWADLLSPITSEALKNTSHGWRFEKGELFSPGSRYAAVPLAGNLSGFSYQMRMKFRRIRGEGVFHVVLPVGDRMTGFQLNGRIPGGEFVTGLILVNGKWGKEVPGFVEGQQINDSDPHDLDLIVRLDGYNATISVTLDAKPLYQWTGPVAALSQAGVWAKVTEPSFPALGTTGSNWAVSEVKVKRLDDSAAGAH